MNALGPAAAPSAGDAAPRRRAVDVSVVLRAVAIVCIAASHAELVDARGGAHVLLAVVGYNLARFRLTDETPARRAGGLLRSAARVAVPSVVWITAMVVLTGRYLPVNAALVHGFLGPDAFDDTWAYWFVEVVVWTVLGAAALARVPVLHRAERSAPFATAAVVLAVALAFRFEVVTLDTGPDRIHTLHHVLWLVALGWAAARAGTTTQRVALSAVAVGATWGWFSTTPRGVIVVVGLLLLIWCRTVRLPSPLVAPLAVLATSSLYIYLTHFQVYPLFERPAVGLAASLVVGVAAARGASRVTAAGGRQLRAATVGRRSPRSQEVVAG